MRIIAGTARGRRIEAPEGKNTRPTLDRVRENLFNILQTRVRSSTVLDLFAGSGALSMEALSRGAASAVLCDLDREAHRVEKKNAEALGFTDRAELFLGDWRMAVRRLAAEKRQFDLIFLDPPYRMTDLREVCAGVLPLLAEDGLIVVEHEARESVQCGGGLEKTDERKWGFCGISFYRRDERTEKAPASGDAGKEEERQS